MTLKQTMNYLIKKKAATLDYPFGDDVHVYRVKDKMFALLGQREWNGKLTSMLNLKIDPEESFVVRDLFSAITTGYHMSKIHWISIYLDGTVPKGEVERLIDGSYDLIVSKLPKLKRLALFESPS